MNQYIDNTFKSHHQKPKHEQKAPEAGEAAVEEGTEKEKEEGDKEFEKLQIFTTDAIVLNNYSKFHGDSTIVQSFTSEEADAFFAQQYVV